MDELSLAAVFSGMPVESSADAVGTDRRGKAIPVSAVVMPIQRALLPVPSTTHIVMTQRVSINATSVKAFTDC